MCHVSHSPSEIINGTVPEESTGRWFPNWDARWNDLGIFKNNTNTFASPLDILIQLIWEKTWTVGVFFFFL